jgi:hypothetical protein
MKMGKPKVAPDAKLIQEDGTITESITKEEYSEMTIDKLIQLCKDRNIKCYSNKSKVKLIELLQSNTKEKMTDNQEPIDNVLELCKIPDSVDIPKLIKEITEYMEPRRRFYKETGRNLSIEDEFSEWWITNVSGGQHIGTGSGGMDVKTSKSEGIDVMCVIMNKKQSNEKSLMQNFSDSGDNLDTLFKEKRLNDAIELYKKNLYSKISETQKEKKLNELYILAFVSVGVEVYIVCFKYNIDRIMSVTSGGFVTKKEKNITTKGFISLKYGNVKLYKSKKRIELRLTSNTVQSPYAVKIYTL